MALVLQQHSLYPRLTVRGNLEFPPQSRIRGLKAAEIMARVDKAAATLQITKLLDRKVERLSGGDVRLHATVPARTKVALDEVVGFGWVPGKVVAFDRATGGNIAVVTR